MAADPWTYVRKDYGGYQIAQAFRVDSEHATLIWSYPPFGRFVAANGNGGETYERRGDAIYITATQDGGTPGVQHFASWWAFDIYVPDCLVGWRESPDGLGRACRQTITFPPGITADTIVSEHYNVPGYAGPMERAFYALGWGRLAWMSFNQECTVPVDAARAPALPAFDGGGVKCDERMNTLIEAADGSLSGISFGWAP